MGWLDLAFGFVLMAGCGGKVVVDEPTTVTAGASSGTGGGSSSSATVSSGSGADCTALKDDYDAKVSAAQACSPAVSVAQCNGSATVPDTSSCCPIVLNETEPELVQAAQAAYAAWNAAGCLSGPCPYSCPAFKGSCQPNPNGTILALTGQCVTALAH